MSKIFFRPENRGEQSQNNRQGLVYFSLREGGLNHFCLWSPINKILNCGLLCLLVHCSTSESLTESVRLSGNPGEMPRRPRSLLSVYMNVVPRGTINTNGETEN